MAERYRFAAPVALVSGQFAELTRLEIEFSSQQLRLHYRILTPEGGTARQGVLQTQTLNKLDQFVNNVGAISGQTFEEKLLISLPAFVRDVPGGGTLE